MISVIIPNYNHAPFLNQRIDSVLNQSFQDFEIIILDDCSTDNSRTIIETYRNHPKISHVIYNDINSGSPFKQWRRGISLAKGEYIWIAESDDSAENNFLEKVIQSMTINQSSLCFTQSIMVDHVDSIIGVKDIITDQIFSDSKTFVTNYLLYGNALYNASMIVFKKELVLNILWDRLGQYKYCGDWFFWSYILMVENFNISEVKEPLNKFRIHSNNVSNKSEKNGLTFLEGFKISHEIYKSYLSDGYLLGVFCRKWSNKWYYYRNRYQFAFNINLKILKMFLVKEPRILYYELNKKNKK